jgi:urease accessory protein UreH
VRGDRIEVVGTVREGAHLIVTEQSATRILGGERASAHSASWTVEAGATLELRHEPILALAGSDHRIATHIHAQSTSIVVIREIVNVSAAGRLRLRTLLSVDGREAYYDGIDLDGATTGAVGTLVAHGTSRSLADTFDAASREVEETCRIGIGTLRDGTHARCTSSHVWSVRRTLEALEKRIATCVDQPR